LAGPIAVFGAMSFWWMGEHGIPRIDTSEHVYFANDQLAVRFIEEIDFDYAAPRCHGRLDNSSIVVTIRLAAPKSDTGGRLINQMQRFSLTPRFSEVAEPTSKHSLSCFGGGNKY